MCQSHMWGVKVCHEIDTYIYSEDNYLLYGLGPIKQIFESDHTIYRVLYI